MIRSRLVGVLRETFESTDMKPWLKNPTILCTAIGCFASVVHLATFLVFASDLVQLPAYLALSGDAQALIAISCPLMVVAGPSAGCLFATLVQQWNV